MIRSRVTTSVLVALASVVLSPWPLGERPAFAAGVSAPDDQSRESVLVTGTGEVSGTPDTLTADFAVETSGPAVGPALDDANAAATRMRDALTRAGIARADLQTSNIGVNSTVNTDQVITGYTVTEGLTAKIRNLPHAGDAMSAALAAGGNAARLNGVSFAIENDGALLDQARRKAFADARQKAELYAREAGRPLGRVLTVSETAGYTRPVGPYVPAMLSTKLPIEPGRQQLSVTVTVEWSFGSLPQRA
jgi:uncharacterized protein